MESPNCRMFWCTTRQSISLVIAFLNTIFVSSHMYPENPEGTQVIVGSMNMGYISDTARNRTHNLFRPKRESLPLGHSDGLNRLLTTKLRWVCLVQPRTLLFLSVAGRWLFVWKIGGVHLERKYTQFDFCNSKRILSVLQLYIIRAPGHGGLALFGLRITMYYRSKQSLVNHVIPSGTYFM